MSLVEIKEAQKKMGWQRGVQYKGLCVNCNLAAQCTFPRDPHKPVINCDEFDGAPENIPEVEKLTKKESKPEPEIIEKFKGLCVNCARRDTCIFPKPEWGVWHCEEYE